jgi:hypothetical protein
MLRGMLAQGLPAQQGLFGGKSGATDNNFSTVLRIRDVYPGSRILIFTHPGSQIQKQQQKRGVKKNLLS